MNDTVKVDTPFFDVNLPMPAAPVVVEPKEDEKKADEQPAQ